MNSAGFGLGITEEDEIIEKLRKRKSLVTTWLSFISRV